MIEAALALLEIKPLVIDIDDPACPGRQVLGEIDLRGVPGGGRSGFRLAEPG